MKRSVLSKAAPSPIGPYSQAVVAAGMVYVSGQIAIDPSTGELAAVNDVGEETQWVMRHLRSVLEEAGSSLDQVVKCSIFLKDMDDFGAVNKVYGSFFGEHPPARETVQVSRLPKDVRVEISAMAMVGE